MNIEENLIDAKAYFFQIQNTHHVVCYGAGSKGKQTIEILRNQYNIFPEFFVDSKADKWEEDRMYAGIPVIAYDELIKKYDKYCILITCVYKNAKDIYDMLMEMGEKNPIYFVCNPYKAENKFLTIEEIQRQKEKLSITYHALRDGESKELLIHFLNWKLTGDMSQIANYTQGNWMEFFGSDLIPFDNNYTFIDVGAYTGDTIIRFLAFCNGKYNRIVAFEPDQKNYSELQRFIFNGRMDRIEAKNIGLWMKKEEKPFFSAGGIYESSNFFRSVENTIRTDRLIESEKTLEQTIIADTLDNQIEIDSQKMIIKVDALAAEVPILYGAEKIIKRCKPIIIMEYGTYSEYMGDSIPYLLSLNPEYQFYLRQRYVFDNSRTVLYAV